ncbi:MAG: OmpA family protein [Clostridia bacterium]|nr:OmpA family protein [Clostridia bacterium]
MKKIIAIIMSVFMLATLAACGDDEGYKKDSDFNDFYFEGENAKESGTVLGTPQKSLNPEEIYSNMTYTPEMFYGYYRLKGGEEAEDKFGAESEYFTCNLGDGEMELTVLPRSIKAGKNNLGHKISYIEEYNWMNVGFMTRDENGKTYITSVFCAYSIEGNKLILKPIDDFDVSDKTNKITYSFSDLIWEYTFKFSGRNLTLSNENGSVTLNGALDAYAEYDCLQCSQYLTPGSASPNGIDAFFFSYDEENQKYTPKLTIEMTDGVMSYASVGTIEENGLFTFTLVLEESVQTYQYVYFLCNSDGLVLTDGENNYYFNSDYFDRMKTNAKKYLTEDLTGELDSLSETQLEELIETQTNLMDDLAKAFNDAGIKVTVDENSGELAMDTSVLFGGDSAVLTAEGKSFLNKFVSVYTSIVFSEKYENFVAKTMVEGHTAPVSGATYESSLPLSVERADNVKKYCVSAETGVDTTKLASALEAVGYSNSKPIKDADGNVDMAASRRVSFRFIINIDAVK